MKQNRRTHALIAMASLILGSSIALAHDGIEHVMGTVKTVSDTSITVETAKHEMATIALDPATKIHKQGREGVGERFSCRYPRGCRHQRRR